MERFYVATIIVLIFIILSLLFFLYKTRKSQIKIDNLHLEIIRQNKEALRDDYKLIEKYLNEKKELKDRVDELEGAIEGGYNVSIRQEVTKVIADFNKIEMVIIVSGLSILLERTSNPDDAKIYIELIEKTNNLLKDMKEDGE